MARASAQLQFSKEPKQPPKIVKYSGPVSQDFTCSEVSDSSATQGSAQTHSTSKSAIKSVAKIDGNAPIQENIPDFWPR